MRIPLEVTYSDVPRPVERRSRRGPMLIGLALLSCAILSPGAKADSVQVVAQELKSASALPLRQNVQSMWATNLLYAQAAPACTYCGTVSLELSIESVLRAISIEAGWLTFCNLQNCDIANLQSTVAINPDASVSLTPSSINFGEVPVTSTPEPTVLVLLALGLLALMLRQVR